jgi:hypothetical protein
MYLIFPGSTDITNDGVRRRGLVELPTKTCDIEGKERCVKIARKLHIIARHKLVRSISMLKMGLWE